MSKLKDIITIDRASEDYDLSKSRLHKATMNNEFPFFRLGRKKEDAKKDVRKIYVYRDDIIAWLTANRVPSRSEVEQQSAIPA
jgi:hypothetical protein